jgi:hypothetical protein
MQGLFLRILWCNAHGNHPKNNLAKFGYIIDVKVGGGGGGAEKKKKT